MKKTVSRQNTNDSTRVHGMYGSMHTDIFEGMGLRGINLSTDDREKNHEVRSNKRKNTGRKALTRAIAAESPLSMGYAVELERFGRGLGAGVKRSGTASAEALRRSASRYRTKAEEAGTSLRALGKLFSIRNLILMLFAALTISAALILMLFNFEKAVVYGNTMYDQKQIEHFITQGRLGENTFVMALKYHNRTVEGLPFVDRIDIDIVSPSTVRVNITEKPLDARVSYGENEVYLSKEGIIQTVSYRTNENTTVVKGLQVVDPETGTRVEAKNQTGLDNTLKLLNVMDRYDLHADSIDVDDLGNLTVAFGDVSVKVGKSEYDIKMYKIHQICKYFKGRSGIISMTGSDYAGENIVLSPFASNAESGSGTADNSGKASGGGKGGAGSPEDPGSSGKTSKAVGKEKTEKETSGKKDEAKKEVEKEKKTAAEKEESKEKTSEKAKEKTSEKSSTITTEKTTEKTTETTAKAAAVEKTSVKTTGKAKTEKTTVKTTKAKAEKTTAKTTKTKAEETTVKTTKARTEKTTVKTTGKAKTEKTTAKTTKAKTEKTTVKTTKAKAEKTTVKTTGKAGTEKAAAETTGEEKSGKDAEKTSQKPNTEKTTEKKTLKKVNSED